MKSQSALCLSWKKLNLTEAANIHVVNADKSGSCLSDSLGGPEGWIVLNWPQIVTPMFIKLDWR